MSDEFDKYLNSKIGKKNKNLDILHNFFEKNQLKHFEKDQFPSLVLMEKHHVPFF